MRSWYSSSNGRMNEVPRGQCATLTGVERDALHTQLRSLVEVGIGADDHRRLAAEFEDDPLQGRCRLGRDGRADGVGPRERHQVDFGSRRQLVTDRRVPGHDVDDAAWQLRLGRGFGDDHCSERCERGGLEHDGVAGREHRSEFHHVQEERKVVGGDGGDDAHRLPADDPAPEPAPATASCGDTRRERDELGPSRRRGPVLRAARAEDQPGGSRPRHAWYRLH